MRGAVIAFTLLALGACGREAATPVSEVEQTPTGQSTAVDADGGRTFADRETFQRYCPMRSAVLTRHLGDEFLPVSVYLVPAEPDGAPPQGIARDVAVCHYASAREQWQFTTTYVREASADRAQRTHNGDREMWAARVLSAVEGDDAWMMYQDFPDGGYLTVRFPKGDVTVEYMMFGATFEERGEALRRLPRIDPPAL